MPTSINVISSRNSVKNFLDTENTTFHGHDLIVFSHLRWEFVMQRPQHIISRLAKGRKVLFVEEPIGCNEHNKGTAHLIPVTDEITILQPHIKMTDLNKLLGPIVEKEAKKLHFDNPVLWFYSPSFLNVMQTIKDFCLIVYDCMDELSAFKGASPELKSQEETLLSYTDLVFTGGKSLYESKKNLQDNVYCFPSSVDRSHFAKAFRRFTKIPRDIGKLKKPVVGFYGVIDERIDLNLLKQVAKLKPDISFVMIGPVVKISVKSLPHVPNIHYLGPKKYETLPAYLKGMDIAMMPFALNESTKFISPTKTLEFMAGRKPVISTAIYDVVRDYSNHVSVIKDAAEFAHCIDSLLHESAAEKTRRLVLQQSVLERTSWDTTVNAMQKLIDDLLEKKFKTKKKLTNKFNVSAAKVSID